MSPIRFVDVAISDRSEIMWRRACITLWVIAVALIVAHIVVRVA